MSAWLQPPQGFEIEIGMSDEEETDEKKPRSERMRGKNVKLAKLNKVTKRRTTADYQPTVFRRYLTSLNAVRVPLPQQKFKIVIRCGNITTMQSGGYREPAIIRRIAADDSGINSFDRVIKEMAQDGRERINKLDRSRVKTMRMLFGHGRGVSNWNDASNLIAALGLEVLRERGSSYTIA
ncbi:hypothetical protein CI238_00316 [Colletotrichum incanum]|uniref:Uncharacterized protein n=1 Tax=Colletotrichum incanum TaxID=1573173 RepID=A0A161Y9N1_COLIC|nr:hypothetical protein CI238_00316 [Colletotrichum incanum]